VPGMDWKPTWIYHGFQSRGELLPSMIFIFVLGSYLVQSTSRVSVRARAPFWSITRLSVCVFILIVHPEAILILRCISNSILASQMPTSMYSILAQPPMLA